MYERRMNKRSDKNKGQGKATTNNKTLTVVTSINLAFGTYCTVDQ